MEIMDITSINLFDVVIGLLQFIVIMAAFFGVYCLVLIKFLERFFGPCPIY
jgi:hypothetical protein